MGEIETSAWSVAIHTQNPDRRETLNLSPPAFTPRLSTFEKFYLQRKPWSRTFFFESCDPVFRGVYFGQNFTSPEARRRSRKQKRLAVRISAEG
jgi:hypothetical protein